MDIFPTLVEAAGFSSLDKCPKSSHDIQLCTEGKSLTPLFEVQFLDFYSLILLTALLLCLPSFLIHGQSSYWTAKSSLHPGVDFWTKIFYNLKKFKLISI